MSGTDSVQCRTERIPFDVHLKERVMQAAVVSVLLMAGACGNSSEPLPAPAPTRVTTEQSGEVPVCIPSATFHGAATGAYHHAGHCGGRDYSPVWFLHDCAVYYPGNYAEPYDYREIFNYPWHGPRPPSRSEFVPIDESARRPRNEIHSAAR
jgi:hypothetical protein